MLNLAIWYIFCKKKPHCLRSHVACELWCLSKCRAHPEWKWLCICARHLTTIFLANMKHMTFQTQKETPSTFSFKGYKKFEFPPLWVNKYEVGNQFFVWSGFAMLLKKFSSSDFFKPFVTRATGKCSDESLGPPTYCLSSGGKKCWNWLFVIASGSPIYCWSNPRNAFSRKLASLSLKKLTLNVNYCGFLA